MLSDWHDPARIGLTELLPEVLSDGARRKRKLVSLAERAVLRSSQVIVVPLEAIQSGAHRLGSGDAVFACELIDQVGNRPSRIAVVSEMPHSLDYGQRNAWPPNSVGRSACGIVVSRVGLSPQPSFEDLDSGS